MDTAVLHHDSATMGIVLDSLLVSKKLEQHESLGSFRSCSFTHSWGPHAATGALVQTQLLLDPSLHRGSVGHRDLSPSSSLRAEHRSGSLCEILLSPPCAHEVSLTTGCDPELLVSSRRLPEVTVGSGLNQDHMEEGCIVSMPGGCSLIKPKYMQSRAGAKRDPSLLSNGPATGDEGESLLAAPDKGG